jgi:hypothetical protein
MAAEIDFNALGQAFDTTWGRTSTPKSAGYSVKFDLNGPDALTAKYVAVVNFACEREMTLMRRRYDEESTRVLDAVITAVKSRYKSLTGSAIKMKKDANENATIEIISMNVHNPKRTAYYRKAVRFELA